MDKNLCFSLITWLKTFPGHESLVPSDLTDGVALAHILRQIAPEHFSEQWLTRVRADVADNWRLKVSNLKKIYQGVMDFFYHTELPVQALQQFPTPDVNKIVEHEDEIELGRLLQLILGCAINCIQKQKHIEDIMRLEESVQTLIVNAIQDLMSSEGFLPSPEVSGGATAPSGLWSNPPSFHPQMKTMMEQLENLSLAKESLSRRCNELDLQVSVLTEEKKTLKDENEKLLEKVEILEVGGDVGGQSFRNKDLRKQVESLQVDLFKLESSRDEYRSRVDNLEKENNDLTARIDELQNLADEARTLKDEVDALRDMSERVAVYEGTVETYKKKLEELSDLRRQVKILEEKNSEYMQQNMELEEEIKKSGTWRPQLDLYKKQVSELHQKLSDEAKKTDRQVFENKKMTEKMEAVTQEKERIVVERDVLKENVEELKCTISALNSPDAACRTPADLTDLDTLEIVPPEIREKLVRLQHENRVLKQRANDKCDESSSVLHSLLGDLQERHDKIMQENRLGKSLLPNRRYKWPLFDRVWPFAAYLMSEYPEFSLINKSSRTSKRVNVKWASDSDLLNLQRQFCNDDFYHNRALTNSSHVLYSPSSGLVSSKSLSSPARAVAKGSPIVIRHIHEFKVASSSPTNEDSGCCRTSPSSCEGCDDRRGGMYRSETPDYGSTLDSGISGVFRCLSPVIPSIVEECTFNHISDILPAIRHREEISSEPLVCHNVPSYSTATSNPSKSRNLHDHFHYSVNSRQLESNCLTNRFNNSSSDCESFDGIKGKISRRRIFGDSKLSSDSDINISVHDNSSISLAGRQSLSLRPEPTGSPTPHNSPKLPHSLHNSRNRINKLGISPQVIRKDSKSELEGKRSKGFQRKSDLIKGRAPHLRPLKTNEGFLETDLDSPFESRIRCSLESGLKEVSPKDSKFQQTQCKGKNHARMFINGTKREICSKTHSLPIDKGNSNNSVAHSVANMQPEKHLSPSIQPHISSSNSNETFENLDENSPLIDQIPEFSKHSFDTNGVFAKCVNSKAVSPRGYQQIPSTGGSSKFCTESRSNSGLYKMNNSSLGEQLLQSQYNSKSLCGISNDRSPVNSICGRAPTAFRSSSSEFTAKKPSLPEKTTLENDSTRVSLNCFPFLNRSKAKDSVTSDQETDAEVVENKLIASAYAAPIASSESSTSFYHSDTGMTDFDPSATDYCTETEADFNPHQYKITTLIPDRSQLSSVNCADLEALIGKSSRPIVRPPSYLQRKKIQMTPKIKLKNGSVIKVKNKTAKALAAETFNAMFLLCTP